MAMFTKRRAQVDDENKIDPHFALSELYDSFDTLGLGPKGVLGRDKARLYVLEVPLDVRAAYNSKLTELAERIMVADTSEIPSPPVKTVSAAFAWQLAALVMYLSPMAGTRVVYHTVGQGAQLPVVSQLAGTVCFLCAHEEQACVAGRFIVPILGKSTADLVTVGHGLGCAGVADLLEALLSNDIKRLLDFFTEGPVKPAKSLYMVANGLDVEFEVAPWIFSKGASALALAAASLKSACVDRRPAAFFLHERLTFAVKKLKWFNTEGADFGGPVDHVLDYSKQFLARNLMDGVLVSSDTTAAVNLPGKTSKDVGQLGHLAEATSKTVNESLAEWARARRLAPSASEPSSTEAPDFASEVGVVDVDDFYAKVVDDSSAKYHSPTMFRRSGFLVRDPDRDMLTFCCELINSKFDGVVLDVSKSSWSIGQTTTLPFVAFRISGMLRGIGAKTETPDMVKSAVLAMSDNEIGVGKLGAYYISLCLAQGLTMWEIVNRIKSPDACVCGILVANNDIQAIALGTSSDNVIVGVGRGVKRQLDNSTLEKLRIIKKPWLKEPLISSIALATGGTLSILPKGLTFVGCGLVGGAGGPSQYELSIINAANAARDRTLSLKLFNTLGQALLTGQAISASNVAVAFNAANLLGFADRNSKPQAQREVGAGGFVMVLSTSGLYWFPLPKSLQEPTNQGLVFEIVGDRTLAVGRDPSREITRTVNKSRL